MKKYQYKIYTVGYSIWTGLWLKTLASSKGFDSWVALLLIKGFALEHYAKFKQSP